jgi:hypothetical protein
MLDYYKGETELQNPVSLHYVGLQNHNYNLEAPKDFGYSLSQHQKHTQN